MKPRVYIETTIPSYLTAWPSQEPLQAAHQELTRQWWDTRRESYELCASQLVRREAGDGDPQAAADRLNALSETTLLETTNLALDLATELLRAGALPAKAADDALHIAIAASNGVEYLLTWNCRHLANAMMRPVIESTCARFGLVAPIICTPMELMGELP